MFAEITGVNGAQKWCHFLSSVLVKMKCGGWEGVKVVRLTGFWFQFVKIICEEEERSTSALAWALVCHILLRTPMPYLNKGKVLYIYRS